MRPMQIAIALTLAASILAPTLAHADPVTAGRRLFLKYNCYGCHGINGGGGMGPNIRGKDPHDVASALNGGERQGGMRSFVDVVSAADRGGMAWNISAYLATIETANEPTWVDWWLH